MNMPIANLVVRYIDRYGNGSVVSKVYAIDRMQGIDVFLIVNEHNRFEWVEIDACEPCEEVTNEST